MARRKKKNKLQEFLHSFVHEILLSSQGLPIILSISILGVLLVLFRMKSVEQDYQLNEITKETKRVTYENKDLKAQKARRLSVKSLQKMAKKYNLSRPKQNQIIVIP